MWTLYVWTLYVWTLLDVQGMGLEYVPFRKSRLSSGPMAGGGGLLRAQKSLPADLEA